MLVDLAVLAGFVTVALRSKRFWPLWVAGLQLTTSHRPYPQGRRPGPAAAGLWRGAAVLELSDPAHPRGRHLSRSHQRGCGTASGLARCAAAPTKGRRHGQSRPSCRCHPRRDRGAGADRPRRRGRWPPTRPRGTCSAARSIGRDLRFAIRHPLALDTILAGRRGRPRAGRDRRGRPAVAAVSVRPLGRRVGRWSG